MTVDLSQRMQRGRAVASGVRPISLDLQDVLFGATTVCAISGIKLGSTPVPLFALFVILAVLLNLRLFNPVLAPLFAAPPLLMFLLDHDISAFRGGLGLGVFFVAQSILLCSFVWVFVARYAYRPMGGYLRVTGIGVVGLLAFVVIWHIANGFYFSWKHFTDAKAVFDFLPLLLVVMKRSPHPWVRAIFPAVCIIFIAALLISGERKAYILLGITGIFLLDFRNPLTYTLPLAIILAAPIVLSVDKSGYVARQVDTLAEFAQGRVAKTISNEGRLSAARTEIEIFKSHSVFGVGTLASVALARRYDPDMPAAHNEWLRVAADDGLVGLFFYALSVLWGVVGVLRPVVLGRRRSRQEIEIALTTITMLILYISLEAFDFIVLLAFMLIPFIQYLRMDPMDGATAAAHDPSTLGGPAQQRVSRSGPGLKSSRDAEH
jgi:hypothetical protein